MPRQKAIRFPDDLHYAIEREAERLGRPWTFSSVVIDALSAKYLPSEQGNSVAFVASVGRGSPSPSLERFAKPETKR